MRPPIVTDEKVEKDYLNCVIKVVQKFWVNSIDMYYSIIKNISEIFFGALFFWFLWFWGLP